MSESTHSLPPEIKGKAHGTLRVQIGSIIWLEPELSADNVHFRLKFWGEKGPGVILQSQSSTRADRQSSVNYTIRCTQPIFVNYLMDMGSLTLDITNSQWRLLGNIKINVKLYLKRESSTKSHLASNFGFSNIDVQGVFPILAPVEPPQKLGEVELTITSSFGDVFNVVSQGSMADLPMKPNHSEKYAEEAKVGEARVAFSLMESKPGEYNAEKVVNKETFKIGREGEQRRDVGVKEVTKKFVEAKELPKEDLKAENNMSMEWENLRAKGERLRKKLEASSRADVMQEIMPPAKEDEYVHLPSISELKALSFPNDPSEVKALEVPERPMSELSAITHLKLSISSLSFMVVKKDINPYLDCVIPLPAIEGSRNDSFKISHKSASSDTFLFNHESLHHVVISDGVFSKLAPTTIKFRLLGNDKGKVVELGRAELPWERILLSKGFTLSADLEVFQEEAKNKRTSQKLIAKLSISCSLINDRKPVAIESEALKKPQESARSFLLYLFLDHVNKLSIPLPNLYATYKTFPDLERITTEIIWSYKDSAPIAHKMVTAVLATESIISKLSTTSLIIEFWHKSTSSEELIGIVKLPLQLFSSYISSGESLANSVYPIIAFDEYRSINNIKTGEDVGYLKVCLAMGSPLQVNRLRQVQESVPRLVEVEEVQTKSKPLEVLEKSIQFSEASLEKEEVLTQSIESIGDIAAFLNQRNKEQRPPEPMVVRESEPEFVLIEKPQEQPVQIESRELIEVKAEKRSAEEIINYLKEKLECESINLEEELKIADRFSYGYLHSESFSHFLYELRIGLTKADITVFIDHLIANGKNSNIRRVMFSDILSSLGLIQPLYSKHTFVISISQLFSCPVMSRLTGTSIYLKYQFPSETNFIETDLLEPSSSVQINLKSTHSCTFPLSSSLEECFSDKLEGVCIYLCRFGLKGEEKVIGKGILPIEEIIELEQSNRLNRVICLYGDQSEQLGVQRNDLIGKVRVVIEYNKDYAYQGVEASGELVFEKRTEINRKIPRNNVLAVMLESFMEFSRGLKFIRSSGIEVKKTSQFKFYFSLFHEDQELLSEYPQFELASTQLLEKSVLNSVKFLDLSLQSKALEYLNHQTSLLSVFIDNELLGSCKIPLIHLLLHSSVKGEYAILNEFGQFMGLVSLTLSFSIEDFQEKKKSASPPRQTLSTGINFLITIESALNLQYSNLSDECPNVYVQYTWVDGKIFNSKSILRSSCPSWNFTNEVFMPIDQKLLGRPLVLSLMQKSTRGDVELAEAQVDLNSLLTVRSIDGWYHLVSNGRQIGQIKVKITSEEDVGFRFTGKVKQEVFNRLPSPQVIEQKIEAKAFVENKYEERLRVYGESLENAEDHYVHAKHSDNMKAIDNITRTMGMRLSDSFNSSSPLRGTDSAFQRFVPVTSTYTRSPLAMSYPGKKSREISPEKDLDAQYHAHNAFPLRKSRETSPEREMVASYNSASAFPLVHNRETLGERRSDLIYTPHNALPLRRVNNTSPPRQMLPESVYIKEKSPQRFNEIYSVKENKETPASNLWAKDPEPASFLNFRQENEYEKLKNPYEYKEELPQFEGKDEEDDDWNSEKIADMLKTIQEASKYGEQQGRDYDYKEDYPVEDKEPLYHYEELPVERLTSFKSFGADYPEPHEVPAEVPITYDDAYKFKDFAPEPKVNKNPYENYSDKLESRGITRNQPIPKEDAEDRWIAPKETKSRHVDLEERRELLRTPVEKLDSVVENINKRRTSPKPARPALPKSLLSDPEISRIAAIMKGSK